MSPCSYNICEVINSEQTAKKMLHQHMQFRQIYIIIYSPSMHINIESHTYVNDVKVEHPSPLGLWNCFEISWPPFLHQ